MSTSSEERMFEMDAEPPPEPQSTPMHYQTTCHIIEGILGRCTQVEMEIYERAMEHVRDMGEERKRSILKRRLMVRLRKDGYDASLCRSSWVATTQHPGGAHEYIDVHVAGEGGAIGRSRLIVDIDFRSQFELARPAPWYAQLWARLPHVFVGPQEKLRKAVALLCWASRRSLRESGLHVPPWRRSSYMQAKWFPCPGALPGGDGTVEVAQWSVAKERGGGPRTSGLSTELAAQDGSTWME
ncbi:uncharacterized protein LOC104583356 isoform X2 [Brachypodium distachyon]|uniref:DUF506 family protein n=1 Tax=Brachypodium distachyon TaxID=15368 RepID=A0A2K2DGA3_BRADI|nr:uncharacterized protein LOC104583356 isoform X2 [Brachypodium distachyon]PNT73297.1 hypothetical protein BRADI_2g56800v3 [Brachypodium distachyon]|eukprot:XP_010233566.2 uncharacterized protein LOC104583356 isoform X2 [Brachypodium distachyon]